MPFHRKFCLFDVCDLYISNEKTASDVGKKIAQVTPVETVVMYNACKMDDLECIPYLATSVWKYDVHAIQPSLPWLPKSSIKTEKVEIFNQVWHVPLKLLSGLEVTVLFALEP